jgi:hypothetical protein
MGDLDINRPERLARWICKSLKPGSEIDISEVHRLLAEMDRRRAHLSARWRQQVRMEVEDVPEAVRLALSKGWLVERQGRLSITHTGTELARRSRAGSRKRRVTF